MPAGRPRRGLRLRTPGEHGCFEFTAMNKKKAWTSKMNRTQNSDERTTFLRAWASNPLKVAAITPSSSGLARLITSEIDRTTGPVLELGPGTGVFTRALIDRGVPQNQITLVELNPQFADGLRSAFPQAELHCGSATELRDLPLRDNGVGAVVSGLGLLSMPFELIEQVLDGVFYHLRQDGSLYQFTYGLNCSIPPALMEKFDLEAERIGGVLLNLPPASVHRITRRSASQPSIQ